MAQNHEDAAAELHASFEQRNGSIGKKSDVDMAGAPMHVSEKESMKDVDLQETQDGDEPTEVEMKSLRRIADPFPKKAFLVAAVELCERFTCKAMS